MAKRAFIIHGWAGTAGSGWKGWIRKELEGRGFEVFSPQMPNAESPRMAEWLETIHALVGKPGENDYFIGHSLGCIAVLRYIEGLGEAGKIGGAVLVAGFSDDLGIPELKGFFPKPFDFAKMRAHCRKFAAIHSDDDKYVALRYGDEFREKLGAALISLHSRGHFSSSEGTATLPEALEAVLEMAR